jgi:tagatose-1,6-bisphosphate aldolase non-catalytic subunit AgaZ/GatZ
MKNLNEVVNTLIYLRQSGKRQITLLTVCPNSEAVLEAAVKAASLNRTPMLFAATLNQVDIDGGYTGWTPKEFVKKIHYFASKYAWDGTLYPCLDHGGPWLKDRHTLDKLLLDETMNQVKQSLTACVEAGYSLLHVDPTVDRTLPPDQPVPLKTVVDRTIELITHAERVRNSAQLPPIAYEVGTEEVHGGLVDYARLENFIDQLRQALDKINLSHAWPCFIVAQVGTDLHTTYFDPLAAKRLYEKLAPLGSLVKGHYTDWVENPAEYPASGMGGANVGPEFTAQEYLALRDMAEKEITLYQHRPDIILSNIMGVLKQAVLDSGRWKKWLLPVESEDFSRLEPSRQNWLIQTGSRYIWTNPKVLKARELLYRNLNGVIKDPHIYVVDRIVESINEYINQFNLFDSMNIIEARY